MSSCAVILGVWLYNPAAADDTGLFAGVTLGAERTLERGGATDLTFDGFVEAGFESGFYAGLAFSKTLDGRDNDEADLYAGYTTDVGRGFMVGAAYGLHFERADKDCCGDLELSVGHDDGAGQTVNATFSFGLDGSCCDAGVTLEMPAGTGVRFTSSLSYAAADGTYSASLGLSRQLSEAASASFTAGRDGGDQNVFIDVVLSYDLGDQYGIDLGLHDTDTDAPSLSIAYTISLERGGT